MTPASLDITIIRGNSGVKAGLIFRLEAGDPAEPIPYEDVRLSIYNSRGTDLLLRATLGNGGIVVVDEPTGTFAWSPSTEDTRLVPKASSAGVAKATYELEVWNAGSELTYLMGNVIALGGVNDDEDGTNSNPDS